MIDNFAGKMPTLTGGSFRQRPLIDATLYLLCALLSLTLSISAKGQDLTEIELPTPEICFRPENYCRTSSPRCV